MNERSRTQRPGVPPFAPAIGLREVLEASPDLVFSIDPWGRLVWASSAFEPFTGRRVKDLVGTSCAPLLAPDTLRGAARAFLRLHRAGSGTVDRILSIQHTDGSIVEAAARLRVVESPDGERYVVGVARRRIPGGDRAMAVATAAAVAEAQSSGARVTELELSLEEARQVARAKGDFLATMSHEIRTPMNGVIGMTNLLLQAELPSESRHLVELIQHSTQTLLGLINDTLDYSRLEAGHMAVEKLDFDLRVTTDKVSGLLQALAASKGLKFDTRISALVPSRLQGDPGRIRQVLMNLGSNAIKFTEKGSVTLSIDRESEDDHRVTLYIQVKDTGVGIPEDALQTLFEPYVQADASVARRFGGSGLGLAISRRLISAMGGELGVDSEPGEGSTFWIRLKLDKQPLMVGGPAACTGEVALRDVRVLVADGNPGDREPLMEVLQAWGCNVAKAESGPEALRMVHEALAQGEPFEVAVLDRHLEMLDGEELGQAIRADSDLDAMKLIMVTNVGRPGDGGRVKAAGFSAYLMKPLDPSQFYEALAEVLHPVEEGTSQQDRPLVTRHFLAEARRGKLRLLLVDDDPVNQLVTTSALHRVGYNIEVASSGRRAIELTENDHWDLILMDMQMPDLDGCRTTSAIRARERGAWRTPIIGLTANADYKPDRERCLAAGMDEVLGKPVQLEQLTRTVEKYTSPEGRNAEAEPTPSAPPRLTVVSSHFDAPPATVSSSAAAPSRPAARPVRADNAPIEVPTLPEGPAIDLEQLDTACMGLPALRSSLLHTFLHDVPTRLVRLAHAFESGDARRVEFEAHGLKGMCATIGARGCTMLFSEVETWAREDRVADAMVLLDPSINEVHRAEEFIRRFDAILAREVA